MWQGLPASLFVLSPAQENLSRSTGFCSFCYLPFLLLTTRFRPMPQRTAFRLDRKAIAGSFAVGLLFVVLFPSMSGSILEPIAGKTFWASTFPMFGLVAGFALAGVSYGYLSEGETVLEPALAAALVSIPAYFVLEALRLEALAPLVEEGSFTYMMVIGCLNGLMLTFVGAWAGEKLQGTYAGSEESVLSWQWIAAGTILGFAVSLFLANFVIWAFARVSGPFAALEPSNAWVMLTVLFLGLAATGYLCAFRSPGETTYEAGIAGLITVVLLIDVFVFALGGQSILSYGWMMLVLIIGLAGAFVGGALGEQTQAQVEGGA